MQGRVRGSHVGTWCNTPVGTVAGVALAVLLSLFANAGAAFAYEGETSTDPLEYAEECKSGAFAYEPISSGIVKEELQGESASEARSEVGVLATSEFALSGTQRYDFAYDVLELVNRERARQGLGALTMDAELLKAAMLRASECSYFFDHVRPDGSSCFTASPKMMAENIAAGQGSPESVVASWMSSQGHRANILSPMARSVGVGCFYQSGALFWTIGFSTQEGVVVRQPANSSVSIRGAIDDSLLENKNFQFGSSYFGLAVGESIQGEVRFVNPGWSGHQCELDASTFSWRSDDPAVATVDAAGIILGRQGGATKIVASIGSRVSLSIDACVRLEAPVASVKQKGSYAVVSWGEVLGAGSYQVYRGSSSDVASQSLVATTTEPSYRDANVVAHQTYYYTVRALLNVETKWDCSSRHSNSCSIVVGEVADPSDRVKRLWGATALDTMQSISLEGSAANKSPVAVVATMDGYWDALTASSVAGLNGCPILLTEPDRLSAQAAGEIGRLGAKHVIVSGGEAAVSKGAEGEMRAIAGRTSRMAGADAVETALETYKRGIGSWGKTAIVATSSTYHDALAASPYSYSKRAPIFLTNPSTKMLDADVLKAMRDGGFARVLICGGYAAIPQSVEASLSGMQVVRKGGATAYETSVEIANWCLSEGMSADGMGVATATGHWDALAGAAFCGKGESVIVLADDGNRVALDSFVRLHKAEIERAYVFGGSAAVSNETYDALIEALR